MSWDREGQYVTANHMGLLISGTVTHSRVKYGGEVQHTLAVDTIHGCTRDPLTTTRLVSEASIVPKEIV
jgi:hypothetical protein